MVDIDNAEIFETNTGKTVADINISDVLEYEKAPEEIRKEFDDYLEGWFKKNNDSVIFPDIVPLPFWDWMKEREKK